MEEIGSILKQRRKELGLRQVEVGKETGINISRLSLIENTWVRPRRQEVHRIEAALERLSSGNQKDS